jgi:hypothetical protein
MAFLMGAGAADAAAAPKKKPAAKSTVRKPAAKRPVARSGARARARYTARRGSVRGRSPRPVAQRYYRGQQAPTPERYLEIQQALASRGYLTGEPSGKWDPATQDALKRFQEEQNLTPTGKITSLSLIALGLGPKRSPAAANTAQTPPEAQQIP